MTQQTIEVPTNEEIIAQMAEADFNDWRWQNGSDDDAMDHGCRDGLDNFMSGYSVDYFRARFQERGGILTERAEDADERDDASEWLERLHTAVIDEFYAA